MSTYQQSGKILSGCFFIWAENLEKKVLLIEGMTCVNCQNRIEQALRNTTGISKVNVSCNKGQAEVEFDNEILTLCYRVLVF